MSFNAVSTMAEDAGEDHKDELEQRALAFTVKDPVKVGKVTKYTVTG